MADDDEAVSAFGRRVVETGLDSTIGNWFATFDGRMRYPGARELEVAFLALPPEGQDFARRLVVAVADEAVHNTLRAIERLPWISVIATNELTGATTDITDASDGLSAAYEGDEGWRATFAQHDVHPTDASDAG